MEQSRSLFAGAVRTGFQFVLTLILAVASFGPLVGQSGGRTDQTSRAKEKKAEEDVVKLVETFRQAQGLPKLHRINDPHLREGACESAKRSSGTKLVHLAPGTTNVVVPSGIVGDVGNLSTFSYMAVDPSQPSVELKAWATQTAYDSRAPIVWPWVSVSLAQGNTRRERTGLTPPII
jgi:hypothetical protein